MCGIFGIIAGDNSELRFKDLDAITKSLFTLSESRGKESAGIAIKNNVTKKISVLKKSVPATTLIKSHEYRKFFSDALAGSFDETTKTLDSPIALIAHARLVTNGSQENNNNNQPVIKDGTVAVHNGIITNVDSLWKENSDLKRSYEVDTEVFLSLVHKNLQFEKSSLEHAIQKTYQAIKGTVSTCLLFNNFEVVALATNNASLYYSFNSEKGLLIFASERFIIDEALKSLQLKEKFALSDSIWSSPFSAMLINQSPFSIHNFSLKEITHEVEFVSKVPDFEIKNYSPDIPIDFKQASQIAAATKHSGLEKLLEFNYIDVRELRRCSKCLLPETFPFINYDQQGICNYCHKHVDRKQEEKTDEFRKLLNTYRSKDGKPDIIVPFSGGRDSSFGLHYIVKELNLHPITYTYDWGMVTDLARRNIARVCGKLGIENIIVSADIKTKRENIRKNVSAWLKSPNLGLIPLFMAGDKQFFHFVNKVKEQTNIGLNIWSTNPLEKTDFKTGFCGISPSFDKSRPDYLPFTSKINLLYFYLKNFIKNPAYINSSLIDTIQSFWAYYGETRGDFYQLFDWIKWDEKHIEKILFEEYEWEVSPDTTSTWRIGDGTAAFYNYIYYNVAGFSEFDTFRSNQIREGDLTREEGLRLVEIENRPRYDSMKWYLDTVGIDFEETVKIINQIPKLYRTSKR